MEHETANMDIKEEIDLEIKTESLLIDHEVENTFGGFQIEEEDNIEQKPDILTTNLNQISQNENIIGRITHINDQISQNECNIRGMTNIIGQISQNVCNIGDMTNIIDQISQNDQDMHPETTTNSITRSVTENENINTKPEITAIYSTRIEIKEEINMEESEVSYDYPNFDNTSLHSIDSLDTNILSSVETCMQDEVDIKCENDNNFEEMEKDYNQSEIKTEPQVSQYTEINKDYSNEMSKDVIVKLPSDLTNDNDLLTEQHSHLIQTNHLQDQFQLNSITGNELSLVQEAYGLVSKEKPVVNKIFKCQECVKVFKSKAGLKKHYDVHRSIDNHISGFIRGQATKKANKLKKMLTETQHTAVGSNCKESAPEVNEKIKEGYSCTCGKVFKRRSTMETCLRSHSLFESDNTCITCVTCTKSFKNKDELALHRKRLHRKKFPCKFCPTDYETRKQLFKHLQIHQKVQLMEYKVMSEVMKGKQTLQCFMCSKSYTELSQLKIHVLNDHKQPYKCPLCKNTFTKIVDFGDHTKTYHPEVKGQSVLNVLEAFSKLIKSWKCEECELQFLEADKLALHQIESHSPDLKAEPQFRCTDCRRVFVSQKGLTSHRRIHHTIETPEEDKEIEPGIMCLECRKICKDMEALTSHMRLHSPDRKYPCKFCDFRFATPEKRKAHAEIHTGDMKFVCFICEYTCSSENRLKKHKMSLKHANMKEYLLTGKPLIEEPQTSSETNEKKRKRDRDRSERKRDRKLSRSDSESEEVPCDICGEKFGSESLMLEHKQIHPFIEFPNDDKPSRIFFK